MNTKKLFWIFLPVALIAVGAILFTSKPAPVIEDSGTQQSFDPKNPNFIMGTVTSSSATSIGFMAGQTSSSAQISNSTKLVKQVMEDGVVKLADSSIDDIKPGTLVVVYFSALPQNNVYQAVKIQIIN